MEILIAGSAGNIGTVLYKHLDPKHEVIGCDLNNSNTTDIRKSPLDVDLNPDIVINLVGAKTGNIDSLVDTHINFTRNLCEEYQDSKIIHASSAAVYKSSENPISEQDIKAPRNSYGKAKLLSEEIVKKKADQYVILRIFNPYGLGTDIGSVIPIFIRKAISGEDIEIKQHEDSVRDFIYKRDFVKAFQKSLNLENETINIGTGEGTKLKKLASLIKRETESDSAIISSGDKYNSFVANTNKMEELLGFRPSYDIEEGLKEYLTRF